MRASLWERIPEGGGKASIRWPRLAVWAPLTTSSRWQRERAWWDPKDGELCLGRAKPGEILVEARSRSDVQIDGRIWV